LADRTPHFQGGQKCHDEGWRIQILLRLSPAVPFGLLNYMMGLTKTSLSTYVWSTVAGILPGSFVDIYIGVIGQNLAGGAHISRRAPLSLWPVLHSSP
jgi:uncharacterized membrane protein YdjX (TVP38/TMEM64 family)